MPSVLDDPKSIARLDPADMLGAVWKFPESIMSQLEADTPRGKIVRRDAFQNVVLMGMGGSASVGDVVVDWFTRRIRSFTVVHRESTLPRFVGSNTLFIAISYSGETAETLAAVREARRRGSSIIGVGTGGGTLKKLCEDSDAPFYEVLRAPAPRAALAQMIVGAATALHNCGVIPDARKEIEAVSRELARLRNRIGEVPLSENPAKQLASALKDHLPVIYALQRMSSVARRFKNQLAENSKLLAKYDLLPEAGHNEVEAWASQHAHLLPVLVRGSTESEFEESVFASFKSTISKAARVRPVQVRLKSKTKLGELLAPILYLDFVSVYLAFLRGVNPTETDWIRMYKHG